jgi:hypothetical protein
MWLGISNPGQNYTEVLTNCLRFTDVRYPFLWEPIFWTVFFFFCDMKTQQFNPPPPIFGTECYLVHYYWAHYWPIVPPPDDDKCWAIGGMIGRGNQSTRRKPVPSAALWTTNPTGLEPGSNPVRCGGEASDYQPEVRYCPPNSLT